MKDIQKLMECISELQQFDRLLDLVGRLTMSDEEKAFVRPDEISLEKVNRFNELARKHFPQEGNNA